jgi:predicted MPP superfamily phosphohydrolase
MSFILILISLMLALDLLWWWVTDRAVRNLPRRKLLRTLVAIFALFQFLALSGVLISRFFSDHFDELLGAFVMSAVFIWHFIGLPIFLLALFVNLVARYLFTPSPGTPGEGGDEGSVANGHFSHGEENHHPSPLPPVHGRGGTEVAVSRRTFLATTLTIPPVFTLASTGYSLHQQNDFRLRAFELRMPRLPKALDGLTIAHVSDTHVGGFTRGTVLDKIVEETNKLNADLVLFTGDLINHALSDLPGAVDMLLKVRYREAMFICEGNHDLIQNRFAFEEYARDRRLPILINECATINIREKAIQVLGLRWGGPGARSPRAREHSDILIAQSMEVLASQLRRDAFPILLAHHPHAFDPASDLRIPLTLSGHTHGGQLMLTDHFGFGPAMYRYWSGLYEKQESKLLVSNGVGNWFPLRINAPAEILHLTLRSAES